MKIDAALICDQKLLHTACEQFFVDDELAGQLRAAGGELLLRMVQRAIEPRTQSEIHAAGYDLSLSLDGARLSEGLRD